MRVLIIGGYGVFGGRLARLLADEKRIGMIIAGRSLEKAVAFCERELAGAMVRPAVFDRDGDLKAQLSSLKPHVVVDASGPFQAYGEDSHVLIKAAVSLGISYLDLSDSAEFVEGVAAFDNMARANKVFALSGVSTLPVLSCAAVRRLSKDLDHIETIEGGISPSPFAGVGENVIRAILAYAGKPVEVWRDGKAKRGFGLVETRRFTIRPPGMAPLSHVLFSLVDVPDLRLAPRLWPGLGDAWFGAGPRPEFLHRMLNVLAQLVRFRLLRGLGGLSGLCRWATNTLRIGEHRGGMYMRVTGIKDLEPIERSWHLIAEGDDGPFIPSMAAEAILRRCLAKKPPKAGARPASEELELSDYDKLFVRRKIFTGMREQTAATKDLPLYRRVLGEAYAWLPAPIQAAHDGPRRMAGIADVERGAGPLAGLVCKLMGLPKTSPAVLVEVEFAPMPGGEVWRRRFGETRFQSEQTEGRGPWTGLIHERFGPVAVGLALIVGNGRLELEVRRWSLLGVPMPLALAPRGIAFEHVIDGRFAFDVEMRHPLIGRIVRYRGWLA